MTNLINYELENLKRDIISIKYSDLSKIIKHNY